MSKKKASLFANSKQTDYICLFGVFIHRRILICICFVILLVPVGLLLYEVKETYRLTTLSEREKITYRYDDVALLHKEGYVILVNEQGNIVYEGEFLNGKCNGLGTVYQNNKKRYIGKLVDNEYEDEKGLLYNEVGQLIYEGGFVKGVYEGEGFLYYPSGNYQAQGTFKNGELNGNGIEYYEDGSMKREGAYMYGRLNGLGSSYYEGSNIRQYEGEFMGNVPMGEGTLFSNSGRAWYQGLVYDNNPDYESFVGASFEDVRTHFLDPIMVYTTDTNSAIAIPKQDVIFISKQPYKQQEESEDEETQKSFDVEFVPRMEEKTTTVDESKLFVEAVAIRSIPLLDEELQPYDNKEDDGVYRYEHVTTNYTYMDLYVMMLYRYHDGASFMDAFLKIKETKGEVTYIDMIIPTIYLDRYIVYFHGLSQATMMLGKDAKYSYQIVKEDEGV